MSSRGVVSLTVYGLAPMQLTKLFWLDLSLTLNIIFLPYFPTPGLYPCVTIFYAIFCHYYGKFQFLLLFCFFWFLLVDFLYIFRVVNGVFWPIAWIVPNFY